MDAQTYRDCLALEWETESAVLAIEDAQTAVRRVLNQVAVALRTELPDIAALAEGGDLNAVLARLRSEIAHVEKALSRG
jgi:hypothetical protein